MCHMHCNAIFHKLGLLRIGVSPGIEVEITDIKEIGAVEEHGKRNVCKYEFQKTRKLDLISWAHPSRCSLKTVQMLDPGSQIRDNLNCTDGIMMMR